MAETTDYGIELEATLAGLANIPSSMYCVRANPAPQHVFDHGPFIRSHPMSSCQFL